MLIDLYNIKSEFIIHFVNYIHKYNFRIYFKFNMLNIKIFNYYIFNNLCTI